MTKSTRAGLLLIALSLALPAGAATVELRWNASPPGFVGSDTASALVGETVTLVVVVVPGGGETLAGASVSLGYDPAALSFQGVIAPVTGIPFGWFASTIDAQTTSPANEFTADGALGMPDYEIIYENFGAAVPPFTLGDLSGNGVVDNSDLVVWACCEAGKGSPVAPGPGNVLALDAEGTPAYPGTPATFVVGTVAWEVLDANPTTVTSFFVPGIDGVLEELGPQNLVDITSSVLAATAFLNPTDAPSASAWALGVLGLGLAFAGRRRLRRGRQAR